ncbi:MAG TPA: hypothetical protein VMU68_07625 [Acidimicrobiales bacterium]|nr:hypothetical protein [Acidimicrobiales bacterium]
MKHQFELVLLGLVARSDDDSDRARHFPDAAHLSLVAINADSSRR